MYNNAIYRIPTKIVTGLQIESFRITHLYRDYLDVSKKRNH